MNCLLDMNIRIYFLKGMYNLDRKIAKIGEVNCFISEITVAELKYGIENSKTPEKLRPLVEAFIPKFAILPTVKAHATFKSASPFIKAVITNAFKERLHAMHTA